MTDFSEPLASIDKDGVHVVSENVSAKLAKKNISPSLISGLEKCPASWFSDSFVLRDLIEEIPDNPARRGNLFHKVMEIFFAEPPEARTHQRIKAVVDEVLTSDEFSDMAEMPEVVEWLKSAINGYYSMGAKPEKVNVAKLVDEKGGEKVGLEVFVKGQIGSAKRDVLGFIDRLVVDPRDENAVIIEDWKSGGKAKRWNPKTKSDEGLGEARQQVIYAKLLEQQGKKVTGARLIFPLPQELVTIDLKDENFSKRVVTDVEEADAKLDIFIERNTFEFKPSFLCAWCPLSKLCPAATIKPYAKMQEAYAKQPEPEVLLRGFDLL